jgi:Tol biopolymer transport system component
MRRLIVLVVVSSVTAALAGSGPVGAAVHAQNGKIVFRRYLNASHSVGAIYTINPNGTGLFRVTHAPLKALSNEPDPSPNGRWIDYMVEWPNNPTARSKIFKIRPDGRDRTNLSTSCTRMCQGDGFPDWSNTGWIAFQRVLSADFSQPVGFTAIFVMRPDGSHVHQVTQRGANPAVPASFDDLAPGWAPGGRQIAFERVNDTTGNHAIFVVTPSGRGLHRITPWALDASQPQYSPDGRWICFRSHEPSNTTGNIFLVHPNGTSLHRLTHTPPGTGKWLSCAFSPDGRDVVSALTPIVSGQQQNADVYFIPAAGGTPVDVTNDPSHWDSAPDWGTHRS